MIWPELLPERLVMLPQHRPQSIAYPVRADPLTGPQDQQRGQHLLPALPRSPGECRKPRLNLAAYQIAAFRCTHRAHLRKNLRGQVAPLHCPATLLATARCRVRTQRKLLACGLELTAGMSNTRRKTRGGP